MKPTLVALLALIGAAGCMPWALGQGAELVAPGEVHAGVGVAVLTPTDDADLLPVPQAWVAVGIVDGIDATAAYAVPMTGELRLRGRVLRRAGSTSALSAGLGVVGFPDVVGAGKTFWTPYTTAALQTSWRARLRPYASARVFVPFVLGDQPTATIWFAPQAGLELEWRGFRWGPELGVIVPATQPGDVLLSPALWVRWDRSLP